MYNSVLSWYLTSLPKSGYKTYVFVKNDIVLYHMIKYVFLQEFAKKIPQKSFHILLGVKMYSVIPRYQISLWKSPPKSSYKGYNFGVK